MVVLRMISNNTKITVETEHLSNAFLREQALKLIESAGLSESLKTSSVALIHHGKILSKDEDLAVLHPSSVVNIVFKKNTEVETPREMNDQEIRQLAIAFRTALMNCSFRGILTRVVTPEYLESLCATTPGLRHDPVALAFLHSWEMLIQIIHHATAKKIAKTHPALADAATQIAAMSHEGNDSALPAAAFRALQRLDEDEREESDEDDTMDSESPVRSSQQSTTPGSPITPAFLAAALARARGQGQSQPSTSGNTPVRAASTSAVSSLLTPEMMQSALRSAFASSSLPSTPVASGRVERRAAADQEPSGSRSAVENLRERYGQFLPQMRELGILNDELSLRALDVTNGDMSAAVNLIFAGMVD